MMRRRAVAGIFAVLVAGQAHAACREAPIAETPAAFLAALTRHMARSGAGQWFAARDLPSGGTMYATTGTNVRMFIVERAGLISNIVAYIHEPTETELTRVKAAVEFAFSRFSGQAPREISSDADRELSHITRTHQPNSIMRNGTRLFFTSPDGTAIGVMVSNPVCE
jgi:hypothetical protein